MERFENISILTRSDEVDAALYGESKSSGAFLLANLTGVPVEVFDQHRGQSVKIPPVDDGAVSACVHGTSKCGSTTFAGTGVMIAAHERQFVAGLPERRRGLYYVVTEEVAEAAQRNGREVTDLLIPCSNVRGKRGFASLAPADAVAVEATFESYRREP